MDGKVGHGRARARGAAETRGPAQRRRIFIDREAAAIAATQHRCIKTAQLMRVGLSEDSIHRRVERGWLVPAHRGVYWLGGSAGPRSHEMAAVLALGRGAYISHLSGARIRGYLPYPAPCDRVDVSVAGRKPTSRPGIRVHRAGRLVRADVEIVDSIPVSSPARTLIEIAATEPQLLDLAYDEAVFRRAVKATAIAEIIQRFEGSRGVAALRALHEDEAADDRSRLEGEKRLRALIAAAGLPRPTVNAPIGRYRVDFLWPDQRVIVEMDGFAQHGKRRSFESDRARDADLQASGYRVIRVTWRQLTHRPYEVIARIAAVLAQAASSR
jgi:very-short-patch-repair endonuclease